MLTSAMHMWLKNEGSKSRHYEVIAPARHFGSHDLVTLKLGQGQRVLNLGLLWCTCGLNEDSSSKRYSYRTEKPIMSL